MLIQACGTCEICKVSDLPFTIQEAQAKCLKCGNKYKACLKCQAKGCPECSGKLESQMDMAAKNGIMF